MSVDIAKLICVNWQISVIEQVEVIFSFCFENASYFLGSLRVNYRIMRKYHWRKAPKSCNSDISCESVLLIWLWMSPVILCLAVNLFEAYFMLSLRIFSCLKFLVLIRPRIFLHQKSYSFWIGCVLLVLSRSIVYFWMKKFFDCATMFPRHPST